MRLLTLEDLVELFGVQKGETILRWCEEKKFPRPIRCGKRFWRWPEDQVARWVTAEFEKAQQDDKKPTFEKQHA